MSRDRLDPAAIRDAPAKLNAATDVPWTLAGDKLHKVFGFDDFVAAFSFMSGAALVAESMNRHPEWSNVYNRVAVELSTHDAGGITELDFALAGRMDALAAPRAGG